MFHIQSVVAFIIVAGAAFFLVRRIRNSLKKEGQPSCNCSCSGCEISNSCEETHGPKHRNGTID